MTLTNDEECRMNEAGGATPGAPSDVMEQLYHSVDSFVQQSNDLYQAHLQQQYQLLELQQVQVEVEHLRRGKEQNTQTIQNLLQALEASRTQAQDSSHAALTEAHLRAELSVVMAQRDEATSQAEQLQHTVALLQEQIQDGKMKLARLTQQKIQFERDCLRHSAGTHRMSTSSLDRDYSLRQVQELQGRVQSLQMVLAEKNRQIEELTQQLDRQWKHPSSFQSSSSS